MRFKGTRQKNNITVPEVYRVGKWGRGLKCEDGKV